MHAQAASHGSLAVAGRARRQRRKPAHLKPGRELLQLRDGARGAAVDVAGLQASLVVGEDGERLANGLGGQLLAPALAGAPVSHLACSVDLHPDANSAGSHCGHHMLQRQCCKHCCMGQTRHPSVQSTKLCMPHP